MARGVTKIELTDEDWAEIYYALEDKARRIEKGEYGPEEEEGDDEDWIAHLKEIMENIASKAEV